MSKDVPGKPKAYLKKMRKALKKAPILFGKESEQNLEQIDWSNDMKLRYAKEQLFSRLSNDERHEARKWMAAFEHLTGGSE